MENGAPKTARDLSFNPFGRGVKVKIKPKPGWAHVLIVERDAITPTILRPDGTGRDLILPKGDTRSAMRIVAKVLSAGPPLSEDQDQLVAGEMVIFAPLVRAVQLPRWSDTGEELLMRYECIVSSVELVDQEE